MSIFRDSFDVIVVGAGHAGIEASLASARMGCSTGLITMDLNTVGRMSCNPAIGGSAKGHLVREIDALGGEMGRLADATGIHFRMLNKSKGPAIWSPRCQSDREWYSREAARRVLAEPGITCIQDTIVDVCIDGRILSGIVTGKHGVIQCKALVICSGTFLNAVMHTGHTSSVGGRFGEPASSGLSDKLASLGITRGRLKTGTPPRIDRYSVDYGETEIQNPDNTPQPFSFSNKRIWNDQIPMYLTYTNAETHDALRLGFDASPMFTGRIKGVGPRYCPSIEDKLFRFADKERHQIFLEPEGYESNIVYVNGFSTSLPAEVQAKALSTIPALTRARMLRPGYAVEYDFFPPHQLEHSLESKLVSRLFFAGQVNGTSGYEEAAAQGLMAGINAALKARGEDPIILKRSESYIGVLIDDLINKGTDEPYRIFTSRAEYRLLLRQDNADSRLMRIGYKIGLVSRETVDKLTRKEEAIARARRALEVNVKAEEINHILESIGSQPIAEAQSFAQLLKRPEVGLRALLQSPAIAPDSILRKILDEPEILERIEIELKYEGYLKRQEEQIRLLSKSEAIAIPNDFDFTRLKSLSREGQEKLNRVRPRSLAQASRISGVTPADVSVLLIALRN